MTETSAQPPGDPSRASGEPPAVAGETLLQAGERLPPLLELAAGRLRTLSELLERHVGGFSVDDVHDLRVATRRLEEVARLISPLMDDAMAGAARESLRSVRKAAGAMRDLDVLGEHLERARLPRPLGKVAREIAAGLPGKRAELEPALAAVCGSASVSGAMVFLARVIEAHRADEAAAARKLEPVLGKRVRSRRKQMLSAFGKAARKQTPGALHEARIAVKRLRYVLEIAHETGSPHGRGAGRELTMLKAMQKILGDHHDTHVIMETIGGAIGADALPAVKKAWAAARKKAAGVQAKRAAGFLVRSYLWRNRG